MTRSRNLAAFVISLVLTPALSAQISSQGWSPGKMLETSLLFYPAKATESWIVPPRNVHVEDIWLQSADGNRIHAWWFPRQDSQEAVLFCHGNAGNLSQWTPTVVALMNVLGQSILIFDYPGYGRSEGKPSEAGCYAAGNAAYDWLIQQQHILPERIVLFGESLGGGVATDLAVRRPHRALILVKTFTSIPDMARRQAFSSASTSLVQNRFDNLGKIGRCPSPVLIAHGDRDRLIPVSQGQKLYEAAPRPKQFFLMKGCDHNDPYPPQFFAAVAKFLK